MWSTKVVLLLLLLLLQGMGALVASPPPRRGSLMVPRQDTVAHLTGHRPEGE